MVIPASKFSPVIEGDQPIEEQAERQQRASYSSATRQRMVCPRCSAQLIVNYDEPECLQCGYVDYSYTPNYPSGKTKSIMSAGTHYILRYVGEFPSLANTVTHVKLKRLRNRVVFSVSCPFCGQTMTQSSLSGKRRESREERYKCGEGHRVSLIPNKSGSLGWK